MNLIPLVETHEISIKEIYDLVLYEGLFDAAGTIGGSVLGGFAGKAASSLGSTAMSKMVRGALAGAATSMATKAITNAVSGKKIGSGLGGAALGGGLAGGIGAYSNGDIDFSAPTSNAPSSSLPPTTTPSLTSDGQTATNLSLGAFANSSTPPPSTTSLPTPSLSSQTTSILPSSNGAFEKTLDKQSSSAFQPTIDPNTTLNAVSLVSAPTKSAFSGAYTPSDHELLSFDHDADTKAAMQSKNTEEYLRRYYGDNYAEMKKIALLNRGNTLGGSELYSTTWRTPDGKGGWEKNWTDYVPFSDTVGASMRHDPVRNVNTVSTNVTKAFTGSNRSHANPVTGSIYIAPNQERAFHEEVSHNLNSPGIGGWNGTVGDTSLKNGTGYHTGENFELGSALGTLRRDLYRSSKGTLDIGNPEVMQGVLDGTIDMHKHTMSGLSLRFVDDAKTLMKYDGNDPTIIKRRDQLNGWFKNGAFLQLFM